MTLRIEPSESGPKIKSDLPYKPQISVNIICKDEERNITGCLTSAKEIADEIILVDTGSADNTVTIAENMRLRKLKIVRFPWNDNFAEARNEAIKHSTGRYIFWMDADDRIDRGHETIIRNGIIQHGDENTLFVVQVHNMIVQQHPNGMQSMERPNDVFTQPRAFPNLPDFRWEGRIHEQLAPWRKPQNKHVALPACIKHYGYTTNEQTVEKSARNLKLLGLELQDDPQHIDNFHFLLNVGLEFALLGGIPGYRARIRPIVSRITIHWPSFYNVVTGKTLALPNLIALQHIPLSPAGVIAKRPAPIALPNSCAAEWRMAPDAVFSPYASVRYFTPHMVHSQYNLL